MQATKLPVDQTTLAPDGSQIRELVAVKGGSLVHCLLPPGATSRAMVHATVEEIWYVVQGRGQVWPADDVRESVIDVTLGVALSVETGCRFQFRNTAMRTSVSSSPPSSPGPARTRRSRRQAAGPASMPVSFTRRTPASVDSCLVRDGGRRVTGTAGAKRRTRAAG